MDLGNVDLNQFARDYLAERGIDPDAAPPRKPFDLADHMVAQAEATLELVLPPRFRTAEPDDPQVLAWIEQFLTDPQATSNLLLRGPVGTGKTHQALGALRRIAMEAARRSQRLTYRFTSHPEFNADMRPQPDGAHLRALVEYQTVDLLVFDDLGAGKATDWTEDTLHRMVDARWANCLPTIATSNLDTAAMLAEVDERVISRLAGSAQIALKGSDRRRDGGGR